MAIGTKKIKLQISYRHSTAWACPSQGACKPCGALPSCCMAAFFAPMLIIFVYVCRPEDATCAPSTWTELWVSWAQPRPATHPRDLHHPRPSHARTLRRAGIHRPHDPVQHGHIARGWPKDSAAQMDCQCAPSNAPRKGVVSWIPTGSYMLPATPQAACGVPGHTLRLHAKRHAILTNWC